MSPGRRSLALGILLSCGALAAASPARANWIATGVFQYVDRIYGPQGFTGATANLPIRKAVVQVLDEATGAILATGGTDASGSFTLNVTDSQTRDVYVRALAYAADSTLYRLHVRTDPYSRAIYAVRGPTVAGHPSDQDVSFNAGSPMVAPMHTTGEAFNILDCLENGVDYEAYASGGVRPSTPLDAYWNPTTMDGAYYSGGAIHLTMDDGYTDPVINHEQGHFMAALFSRDDSPGGTHYLGDNDQDLRLSWSEGWATYFGQSVRRWTGLSYPDWYCDLFSEAADPGYNFSYEIETPSITAVGAASEVSVTASLWDIVDVDPMGDVSPPVVDDNLSLPDTDTWDVFHNYLASPPGGAAVTLEAFWDGWFARGWGHQADMITSFQLEQIEFYPDARENDNFAARAAVTPTDGTPTHHTFYPTGDSDWERFSVTAGLTYVAETTDLIGSADTYLELYGPDTLTLIASNDNRATGDPSSRVNYTATYTGTCYAHCAHASGIGRYGSYDLRVTQGSPTTGGFTDATAATGVSNGYSSRGVAWGDYNNDGYPDLYVCNTGASAGQGLTDRLYRNNHGASFTDVASTLGVLAGVEEHEAAAWGDFDNDGNLDLVVASIQGIHLFHNNGPPGYTFTDVAPTAGITAGGSARSAGWVDVDGDGYLDLYIGNYGAPNQLWHNNGNGTFTLVTRGVEYNGHTVSAAWSDYDQDGRPDLALGLDGDADGVGVKLFHQKSDGSFEDVTASAGMGGTSGRCYGVAWGDYDGDGLPDLAVANETKLNYLFHNRGNGTFTESAHAANVQGGLNATSPAWLDFDNDGDLDLYMVNYRSPANLYDNLNGRSFTTSSLANVNTQARAVAAADLDRNGTQDLYVSSQIGNILYEGNPAAGHHWLEFTLRGRQSNRVGIGAHALAKVGGRHLSREVSGGQAWGSQPSQVVHFGLGSATLADTVVVTWPVAGPNRRVTLLTHVAADQILAVDESTAVADSPGTPPPSQVRLAQNTPNPFNPRQRGTTLRFDLPAEVTGQAVRIAIYDVQGRLERVLLDESARPGAGQTVVWDGYLSDGRRAPDGVHFCRMTVGAQAHTRKILLVSGAGS
ncbi:MAG TPA: FG-GAP-like repeat-containing protein [Candidatus Saccharimonadales bacterium]|nr:FG-GAP-like repeat-containing protein [Candidatus Saccharimonadales bacterium]